jgi:hypothetical protein
VVSRQLITSAPWQRDGVDASSTPQRNGPSSGGDVLHSSAVRSMYRITILLLAMQLTSVVGATAERIKRKPPEETERARLASEQVLEDDDLRKGDIISTDHGFFQIRGLNADGSYDLTPVPNPLSQVKAKGR